jgi:hypothetical protein
MLHGNQSFARALFVYNFNSQCPQQSTSTDTFFCTAQIFRSDKPFPTEVDPSTNKLRHMIYYEVEVLQFSSTAFVR